MFSVAEKHNWHSIWDRGSTPYLLGPIFNLFLGQWPRAFHFHDSKQSFHSSSSLHPSAKYSFEAYGHNPVSSPDAIPQQLARQAKWVARQNTHHLVAAQRDKSNYPIITNSGHTFTPREVAPVSWTNYLPDCTCHRTNTPALEGQLQSLKHILLEHLAGSGFHHISYAQRGLTSL